MPGRPEICQGEAMITVDDKPYTGECASKTLRTIAAEVCAAGPAGGPRLVVGLYLDGAEVEGPEMDALLDAPINRDKRLELVTQPVNALVRSTLEQAYEALEDADRIREQAADLLDAGDQAQAMKELQTLLNLWQEVQKSLVVCAAALGSPLADLLPGESSLAQLLQSTKSRLTDLRTAAENSDQILISDLLRFELQGVLADWRTLVSSLCRSLESPPK